MIIPGLGQQGNNWNVPPASSIDGWLQVHEYGRITHWRRDYAEEARYRDKWRKLGYKGGPANTVEELLYFKEKFKETDYQIKK